MYNRGGLLTYLNTGEKDYVVLVKPCKRYFDTRSLPYFFIEVKPHRYLAFATELIDEHCVDRH